MMDEETRVAARKAMTLVHWRGWPVGTQFVSDDSEPWGSIRFVEEYESGDRCVMTPDGDVFSLLSGSADGDPDSIKITAALDSGGYIPDFSDLTTVAALFTVTKAAWAGDPDDDWVWRGSIHEAPGLVSILASAPEVGSRKECPPEERTDAPESPYEPAEMTYADVLDGDPAIESIRDELERHLGGQWSMVKDNGCSAVWACKKGRRVRVWDRSTDVVELVEPFLTTKLMPIRELAEAIREARDMMEDVPSVPQPPDPVSVYRGAAKIMVGVTADRYLTLTSGDREEAYTLREWRDLSKAVEPYLLYIERCRQIRESSSTPRKA
jgi:hypothetical protein